MDFICMEVVFKYMKAASAIQHADKGKDKIRAAASLEFPETAQDPRKNRQIM